jgi:SAM-dependent methyltransferase
MHRLTQHAERWLAALLMVSLGLLAPAANAQRQYGDEQYRPNSGQEGKDVIWVPTPEALIEKMLQMAKVTPDDFVVDLGSGDGRTVIAAAKTFGARAMGIEFNPDMVALARRSAERAGVAGRAQFVQGDIFKTDFTKATVVTMYLLPNLNLQLRPTILKMKPGTRVVSHAFSMDDWQPDQTAVVEGRTAYFWIVPGRAEGTWTWGKNRPYTLKLRQHFQLVEGLITVDGKMAQFRDGKLTGNQLTFTVTEFSGLSSVKRQFSGRVSGNTIEGTIKLPDGAGEEKWIAMRTPAKAAAGANRAN